jgi:hypothetical protein
MTSVCQPTARDNDRHAAFPPEPKTTARLSGIDVTESAAIANEPPPDVEEKSSTRENLDSGNRFRDCASDCWGSMTTSFHFEELEISISPAVNGKRPSHLTAPPKRRGNVPRYAAVLGGMAFPIGHNSSE